MFLIKLSSYYETNATKVSCNWLQTTLPVSYRGATTGWYDKRVVVLFVVHGNGAVLGIVLGAVVSTLQVEPEVVCGAAAGQQVQHVVAEPEVATDDAEADLELRPRAVEEVGATHVLLDQDVRARVW